MNAQRVERLAEDVTIYLGDCREILPTLAGIDAIITDPPYEDELHNAVGHIRRNDGRKMIQDLGFSGINRDRAEFAKLICQASNGWIIIFCLAEGVRAWRDDIQANAAKYDTTLAWIKPDASPRFNGQGAARGFECAVTAWCGIGFRSWNGGGKRGVFTYPVNVGRQGEHPTEKPVPLMLELISLYTDPGELICDPFCGSGSTGVACAKSGRSFIGIEQNEKWFDLSCRRISEALKQADMFIERQKPAKQESML